MLPWRVDFEILGSIRAIQTIAAAHGSAPRGRGLPDVRAVDPGELLPLRAGVL